MAVKKGRKKNGREKRLEGKIEKIIILRVISQQLLNFS